MLDHDLATLAAAAPDIDLAHLEGSIWKRADQLNRLRSVERATWSAQGLVLVLTLTASTAIGVVVARPFSTPSASEPAFIAMTKLEPSSLLGPSR